MESNDDLTISNLAAKLKSKIEIYDVLIREGNVYLPPKQYSTQKFLREIMLGTKLYIKWNEVKVIKALHYKGLCVKDLLNFAATKVNIKKYLPYSEYFKVPNSEWLCKVINSLISKEL